MYRSGETEGIIWQSRHVSGACQCETPESWWTYKHSFIHSFIWRNDLNFFSPIYLLYSLAELRHFKEHTNTFQLCIMQCTKYLLKWLRYIQRTNVCQNINSMGPGGNKASQKCWGSLLSNWVGKVLEGCLLRVFLDTDHWRSVSPNIICRSISRLLQDWSRILSFQREECQISSFASSQTTKTHQKQLPWTIT